MGPNLYVTPPGSYTDFHLDGFGTVDSGHLCLSGYNEVVMLRRLNTDDQKKTKEILTGSADGVRRHPHGSDNVSTFIEYHVLLTLKLNICYRIYLERQYQMAHYRND